MVCGPSPKASLKKLAPVTLSSLHSRNELHMKFPRVLAVLKFREEVLDAIKREEN